MWHLKDRGAHPAIPKGKTTMEIGKILDIFALIVGVGATFVVVNSKNTAAIITSWGNAFSGSLKAAMGN